MEEAHGPSRAGQGVERLQTPLTGKTAIVTGAGRGLGSGVAKAFSRAGARTVLMDVTDDELTETATALMREGGTVLPVRCDVADAAAVTRMVAATHAAFGPVDVLVNAAAILDLIPFAESTFAGWQRTLAINLSGPWLTCKAVLPDMLAAGRGSVINVSSRAGVQGFAHETAYCAAKFGLEGFSYSLALEVAAGGVAVNLVSPGIRIKPTSMTMAAFRALPPEEQAQWADPTTTGDGFVYLALQDGQSLTGQRFNVHELAERVRREGLLDPYGGNG